MKINYQKIVGYTVKVTPRQFVEEHLIEIHLHKHKDQSEYDFFIRDRVSKGMLYRQFTLPSTLFNIEIQDFSRDNWHKDNNECLISVLETLPNWENL